MKKEIREERLRKFGCITWCEDRSTQCFGILTEDGICKYKVCLHDRPEWIEQQRRIELKRKEQK